MLGFWRKHNDYQDFISNFLTYCSYDKSQLPEYNHIISKLWLLDLDPLEDILRPHYSNTGRPANKQPEFFRTFIVMHDLGIPICQWINKLKSNFIIRTICGFKLSEIPSISSFYSFVDRICGPEVAPKIRKFKRKPAKKLEKGEKLAETP